MKDESTQEKLLIPGEVAKLFRVDPKTVTRWAKGRKISSLKTPGGHHRFPLSEVRALMKASFTKSVMQERLEELERLVAARAKP